jgi:TolA-binding protein
MKRTIFTLFLGLLLAIPGFAAEPAKPAASGLITNALRGLTALLPKPETAPADSTAVSTIGIRGSESTATLVNPYWKDDRSNDPAFAAELNAYTEAQNLLQAQKWTEAQQAMTRFLAEHPKSDLVPNARFGQALAAAGADQAGPAADQFRQFARDYPTHPLRADAEKLAAALGK